MLFLIALKNIYIALYTDKVRCINGQFGSTQLATPTQLLMASDLARNTVVCVYLKKDTSFIGSLHEVKVEELLDKIIITFSWPQHAVIG